MGATNYPGGLDDGFAVPTLPENTSLSSGGTARRNHTQHHDDLGAAVMALERNAAQITHDHSGSATDTKRGPKLTQANTHEMVDTDPDITAIHHTLGQGQFQAAAGNHVHDYNSSTIINKPFFLCTSTSRPSNPVLGQMVAEYDTGCIRMWSSYNGNIALSRVQGIENFGTYYWFGMGPDWYLNYTGDTNVNGFIGTTPSGELVWNPETGLFTITNRAIARNYQTSFQHTMGDDQVITFQTGSQLIETTEITADLAYNDFYLRMSDDCLSYTRVAIGYGLIDVYYSDGPVMGWENEKSLGRLWGSTKGANSTWVIQYFGRTLSIFRDGSLFGTIVDKDTATVKGQNNRGWGIGMRAAGASIKQLTPASLNYVTISDATTYGQTPRWSLCTVGSFPVVTLRQTTGQEINGHGSILQWDTVDEDTFGYVHATPGNAVTDINLSEPGIYQIAASIAWKSGIAANAAELMITVNGLDTPYRQQAYLSPNLGVTQNQDVWATLRLHANDVVRIKASHNASSLTFLTDVDAANNRFTHFSLYYLGP